MSGLGDLGLFFGAWAEDQAESAATRDGPGAGEGKGGPMAGWNPGDRHPSDRARRRLPDQRVLGVGQSRDAARAAQEQVE